MDKLTVAIIGCGGAGRNHVIGYSQVKNIEIVGMADIDLEKATTLCSEFGGTPYRSYQEMIQQEKPTIVSVCTREYDHAAPVLFALEHNCHVFCEKIMASKLEEGEQMVAASSKYNRLLGVNYNYRYIDSIQILKEKIETGVIGDIRNIVFNVHAYCHHHALDLIRYLIGDPDETTAILIEDDHLRNYPWNEAMNMLYIPSVAESTVFRKNNTLITLNASHRSFDYPLLEIDCIGTKGKITIENMMVNSINGKLLLQQNNEKPTESKTSMLSLDDIFHRSIKGFIEQLRGKNTPFASGYDGLSVMKLEAAISTSNRTKQTLVS